MGKPKSSNNVTSTSFSTVHLLPKDFRFEHGAPNLSLAPIPTNPVTPLYSIMLLLCSRCGKVVILDRYPCCVVFARFLSCVLGVFNGPVATPAHGLLGLGRSLRLRFISENASLLALYICPTLLSC